MIEEQEKTSGLASEDVSKNHEGKRGKSRHRKKALHASINKLMEFYFSDANLNKDRFLSKLVETDPYVDLKIFLKFNKIRNLTQETSRIAKALKNSTILELSEDENKVRRITPICQKENIEDCMIYVEGLSVDTDHDWLSNIFSRFGSVDYVSIPRYNNTKKIKGYAFIEFSKAEDAQKCLKEFADKNCTLPSLIAPQDLMSIKTFTEDDNKNDVNNVGNSSQLQVTQLSNKRCLENGSEIEDNCTPTESKKPRFTEDKTDIDDDNKNSKEMEIDTVGVQNKEQDEDKKKQKKKNRKRRDRNEQPDIEDFGLRIMSKTEWRILRNKYLNMQREKMKQLKQDLKKTRMSPYAYDQRDVTIADTNYDNIKKEIKDKPKESQPKFTFAEGLIVKIELDEPCTNPKSLKSEFRNDTSVKYIDIHDGTNIIYVRCENPEGTNKFMEKYSEDRTMSILSGDEEKSYWEKMDKDRAKKFDKKDRKENKQRGRDKLLKRAEKELGKHIRFDDV